MTSGAYRARDLLLVPGLLSLARVPLGVAFPFVAARPAAAFAVLVAAGATDVLDGFWARRFHQATPTGAVVDGVTDKLFVLAVVLTLLVRGALSPLELALLATREIGEAPLVLWVAASARRRRAVAGRPTANVPGKLATMLQFAAIAAIIFGWPVSFEAIAGAAAAGAAAAALYWVRTVRDVRSS